MNRGFTLMELIISVVIFLSIIAAFNYLMQTGKTALAGTGQQKQATYLAAAKMEELRTASFPSISAKNGETFADGNGKILINPVASDLLQVVVAITWADNKNPIQLITLRSMY